MDWSKAKTILIMALLFTNIFLIATYGFKGNDKNEIADEQTLLQVLENHDIYLETEIPRTHEDMPVLSIAYADIDEEALDLAISQSKAVSAAKPTDAMYKREADRLIERLGLSNDNVVLDGVRIKGRFVTVTYSCEADGVPVDGCYMKCVFKDGEIESFEYSRIKPVSVSKGKQSTISAAVALMKFMNEVETDEKIYIQDIAMVYWVDEESFEVQEAVADVAFPFWKISYNDGQVKHIEAYEQ